MYFVYTEITTIRLISPEKKSKEKHSYKCNLFIDIVVDVAVICRERRTTLLTNKKGKHRHFGRVISHTQTQI